MKAIDYIYKNKNHLNLRILFQLIMENNEFQGLTEETIEKFIKYLKETPWNTNPSILKSFGLDIQRSQETSSEEFVITVNETAITGGQKFTLDKTWKEINNALTDERTIKVEENGENLSNPRIILSVDDDTPSSPVYIVAISSDNADKNREYSTTEANGEGYPTVEVFLSH